LDSTFHSKNWSLLRTTRGDDAERRFVLIGFATHPIDPPQRITIPGFDGCMPTGGFLKTFCSHVSRDQIVVMKLILKGALVTIEVLIFGQWTLPHFL
jgi:hypothetical protein